MTQFSKLKNIFQPPPPTLRYHSNAQSWRMFLTTGMSAVFMQKLPRTRSLFAVSMKSVLNGVCCGTLGLDIPLDGVLVTIFASHPFSCFNDLKLDNTIAMTPRKVSFDFFCCKFLKKYLCWLLTKGARFLMFEEGFPDLSGYSFLDKFSEKLYLNDFREG